MFYQTKDGYLVVPDVCKVDYNNIRDLVTAVNDNKYERTQVQVRRLASIPSREFPDEISRCKRLFYRHLDQDEESFMDVDPNLTIPMDLRTALTRGRSLEGYLVDGGKAILLKQN